MKRFVIADLHFGDDYINRFERHFATTCEMNDLMIRQWNRVVGKYDMVYVLGDFVGRKKISNEIIKGLLEKLNGYKILIMGNHDFEQGFPEDYLNLGFDEVYKYSIIVDDF